MMTLMMMITIFSGKKKQGRNKGSRIWGEGEWGRKKGVWP